MRINLIGIQLCQIEKNNLNSLPMGMRNEILAFGRNQANFIAWFDLTNHFTKFSFAVEYFNVPQAKNRVSSRNALWQLLQTLLEGWITVPRQHIWDYSERHLRSTWEIPSHLEEYHTAFQILVRCSMVPSKELRIGLKLKPVMKKIYIQIFLRHKYWKGLNACHNLETTTMTFCQFLDTIDMSLIRSIN